jgi:hypothetical protein
MPISFQTEFNLIISYLYIIFCDLVWKNNTQSGIFYTIKCGKKRSSANEV